MAESYAQDTRLIAVETPLGEDTLLLTSFKGQEQLSGLFNYDLEFLSASDDISGKDIVGKNITFSITQTDGETRYFNGFVRRFSGGELYSRHLRHYRAEVVPWLWFLTRNSNCRIFQEKSIPEIIEQVFNDFGFSDFETSEITGDHPKRNYCVQYRETDFNFVSRLLEEEGIFYWFRHEQGKHTLVLADNKGAYKDCPENEIEYSTGSRTPDHISSWQHQHEFRSGRWSQTDYNFETPRNNLLTSTDTLVDLPSINKYEIFDYPGEYQKRNEGDALTRIRMEEEEAPHNVVSATSNCRTLHPGGKFTVKRHEIPAEEGKAYVITKIDHFATDLTHLAGTSEDTEYLNNFTCIPDDVVFRPARVTPKPVVHGPHTAVVVGPSGEDIYPDKYGRVKVQFPWDREGKSDDKSSCWLRVSQNWAGKNWGGTFIPHVGHEVIVSFYEGDPDRPIITGRVYNADNMPPAELPANKTQSVWSDVGGNQTVMESKDGAQFVHTQQTCGNEFLMDGASGGEKIELRDKYGNELVMDAVAGTITIYSPTHKSKMVLGKSIDMFSESDLVQTFNGNMAGKILGNLKMEVGQDVLNFFAGLQNQTIVGMSSKVVGGVYNKLVGGAKHEIIRGFEFKNVKGVKSEVTNGRIFKSGDAVEYNLNKADKKRKGPTLKQQYKLTQAMSEEYKAVTKYDHKVKAGAKALLRADKIQQAAKELSIDGERLAKFVSKKMTLKSDKYVQDAKNCTLKAENAKFKAKAVFNNGALTINT